MSHTVASILKIPKKRVHVSLTLPSEVVRAIEEVRGPLPLVGVVPGNSIQIAVRIGNGQGVTSCVNLGGGFLLDYRWKAS